ncbi:MAG: efflux RND transporter periplasmic adaptor subunit [Salibacteraceae bacterium]
MKVVLRILLILVLVGAVFGTMFYLYQKGQEKPVTFKTQQAEKSTIIKKTVATGSVVPRKEVEVKPRVSGIVEKLYHEPGDIVNVGDLLAKVTIIPDMVALNNAENRLNRARIGLDNAKADYERNKSLLEQEVIAAADFQPFELNLNSALEELSAAESNLEIIKEGVTKKTGQPTNTLIRSTITGMILDIPIEEGNSVIETNTFNDGTTIATVADMGEMIFEGQVDESEVGKISPGMELILSIGAIENRKFKANLEYIAPKGVEEEGAIQFEIRAAVELDSSVLIRAGYSANADIVLDRRDEVMAIPEALLLFEENEVFVEVETGDQQFEKRKIETGLSDGIMIEVLSGISMEDQIKIPSGG